jgi:DNA-binding CsgD family transcriptional regulator/PAS domain-containing protein
VGSQERNVGEYIGLIYEAAVDTSLWPVFLDRLCDLGPGAKSVMMLHDAKSSSIQNSVTARWEDDWTDSYTNYYVKLNKWTQEFAHYDVGYAAVVNDIVPREQIVKTEFYEDWLRPQSLMTGVTISIFKENLRYMNVSVLSKETHDDLQLRNAALLQELGPHLRRAQQITRQVSQLTFRSHALEQAFDHLDRGVVLVNADGRLFYCNAQAERYFDLRDGLIRHHDGRVGCQDTAIELQFARAISSAAATAGGLGGGSAGGIIAIPRRLDLLPWSVMVTPIPASALDFGRPEGVVALFIVNPNQAPMLSTANLRAILGITAAEARAAIGLAEGKSPEEIAKDQGNTILTVRTHLRNAMSKMGISRLPELVALVLRSGITGREAP